MGLEEPYDWIIRFTAEVLLIFTFMLLLLPPLWKLAMSRPGLIIVFSRAFGNFCHLLGDLPMFVVYYMMQISITPPWFDYQNNAMVRILMIVQHTHNLALAVSRAHAMFFPFHYKYVYSKKRNVFLISLFLWLIAIPFAASDLILINLQIYNPSISPTMNLTKYCMYAAGLMYVALGCRMLWMKYKNKSMSGTSTEKDSVKILVVCFSCLAMSSFYQLVMQQYTQYFNQFSYIVKRINYWVFNFSYYLTLCTEEISLCLLVRDFRKFLKQQLRAIFPCCGKSDSDKHDANANTTVATTGVKQKRQQRQSRNAAIIVRPNIVRVTNAINCHQQLRG